MTTVQFAEGLVDYVRQHLNGAETVARSLIDGSKAELSSDPEAALNAAVEASCILAMVAAVRPKLEAAGNINAVSGNGSYGTEHEQVRGAAARA